MNDGKGETNEEEDTGRTGMREAERGRREQGQMETAKVDRARDKSA